MLLEPNVWVLFLNCGYKKEETVESKNESMMVLFAGIISGSIFTPSTFFSYSFHIIKLDMLHVNVED
jgi:hypothetical protein